MHLCSGLASALARRVRAASSGHRLERVGGGALAVAGGHEHCSQGDEQVLLNQWLPSEVSSS
ncbi:hypothetical protein GcM1_247166 [Golovinomyces cichoracearum]|uniref:Uncharacterized protein n=1 Tax=Golovinomyces cichoracearum TaxID=62708 RepID=A0A420IDU9_9PEZI|nr:hypothetical protein GcM1_247166 [Golovinomyces cichoracearum]